MGDASQNGKSKKVALISTCVFLVLNNIRAVNNQAAFYGFTDILSAPKTKITTTNNKESSGCSEITHVLIIMSIKIKGN